MFYCKFIKSSDGLIVLFFLVRVHYLGPTLLPPERRLLPQLPVLPLLDLEYVFVLLSYV